jgi:hypothetical protein
MLAMQQSCQLGCASRLDFDAVAGGTDAGDTASGADATAAMESGTSPSSDDAGGVPDGNRPGEPSPAETGVPARADASATDSGSSLAEAALPTSDAGPNPAMFSCGSVKPAPVFCDDFEGAEALSTWGPVVVEPTLPQPAGSIGVDDRAARAGRGSLLAVVDPAIPVCAGCNLTVCIRSLFYELQGHRQLSIDFDMRVEQIDTQAGRRSAFFQFIFGTPERGYSQHTLQLESSGATAQVGFVEYDTDGRGAGSTSVPLQLPHPHDFHAGPRLHEWVHVTYALDAVDSNGSGNSLKLTVGEVVLVDGPLYFGLRYREPVLELGFPFVDTTHFGEADSNEGWQVRYDNLLVRIEAR